MEAGEWRLGTRLGSVQCQGAVVKPGTMETEMETEMEMEMEMEIGLTLVQASLEVRTWD